MFFSEQQRQERKAANLEKKLFSDNLEAIASGQVSWPELRSQHLDPVPTPAPVPPADQSYASRMESLDAIISDIRSTTRTFNQPDPGSAA